ncbi:MAG: sigma-70 family RNA polymerase sigma factor, partial [Leptolyngbya sp. SIO3F4]|nr:sigma-70 family RNA polymerase sigma factor [Leptolyngbya sp. SIO3F4]
YAGLIYSSFLRDTLRQRQEADICTIWTLLRRVGKQRLVESLRHAGLSTNVIAQYRLAWTCYKALYGMAKVPTRKLRQPDGEQWCAIANLYNTERSKLVDPGPQLSPEHIKQRLTQCASWIREYTYPTLLSLNLPNPNRDFQELQDELSASPNPSLLTAILEEEEFQQRQGQQAQLNAVLASTIEKMTSDNQTLLYLYYHEGLTQKQTAQQLDLKQYTVSRRLTRTREKLLSVLTEWGQTTLHMSSQPDLITDMSIALEEWLTVYYRNRP